MTPDFAANLVKFASSSNTTLSQTAMIIVGNAISCSEAFVVLLLKSGIFQIFRNFLERGVFLEETWFSIQNISAADSSLSHFLLNDPVFLKSFALNLTSKKRSTYLSALRTLLNLIMNSNSTSTLKLFEVFDATSGLISGLKSDDLSILQGVLSALKRCHTVISAQYDNPQLEDDFLEKIDDLDGLDELDKIANVCENDSIAAQAAKLIDTFQSTGRFDIKICDLTF